MSISDLGSLGEFLASIAVFVTLVYLAVQMHRNTRIARIGAINSTFDQYARWREHVINHEDVNEIWLKGCNEEALSRNENRRFQHLATELIVLNRNTYVSWTAVKEDLLYSTSVKMFATQLHRAPGLRRRWDEGPIVIQDWVDDVNRELDELDNET